MPAVPYRGPAGNFYWYDIVLEQQNRPNISCANFKTSLLTLMSYYEIEQTTDLWSLNSGRVQAKLGVNTKEMPDKTPVSFVIIDNDHLNKNGVLYFCSLAKEFVLITSNANHPAFDVDESNLHTPFALDSRDDARFTIKRT